jgi:hypothetical protein
MERYLPDGHWFGVPIGTALAISRSTGLLRPETRQERAMVLNGIGASATRRDTTAPRSAADVTPVAEQRALVPVPGIEPSEQASPFFRRPAAPFLAHLIATAQGEPQTRDRRRAEPIAAAQAYASVTALKPGRTLSRKM